MICIVSTVVGPGEATTCGDSLESSILQVQGSLRKQRVGDHLDARERHSLLTRIADRVGHQRTEGTQTEDRSRQLITSDLVLALRQGRPVRCIGDVHREARTISHADETGGASLLRLIVEAIVLGYELLFGEVVRHQEDHCFEVVTSIGDILRESNLHLTEAKLVIV